MQCRDFRELADSYLSDELLIETNHEVISHLEDCAECRREISARRELRGKLRAAFVNAPERQITREFSEQLSAQLQAIAMNRGRTDPAMRGGSWLSVMPRRANWLALAACLVVAGGLGLFVLEQKLTEHAQRIAAARQNTSQDSNSDPKPDYSSPTSPRMPVDVVKMELAKAAVGDHRDCAIQFRLPEKPIGLEEAGRIYDPAYINLKQALSSKQEGLPAQAEVVEAHSCVFEGRRFAHLVLRYQGRIVSLLVTNINSVNEAKATRSRPLDNSQPQAIACSQIDGHQISCFETARHAVFVVSDLPEGENLAVARALAPAVLGHLARTEIAI